MNRAGVVGAVLAGVVALLVPAGPAVAAPAHGKTADPIQMVVKSITPSTPAASQALRTLTVELQISNSTGQAYSKVRIVAERGEPIGTQAQLDKSLANPAPPASGGLSVRPTRATTVDIPANAQLVSATFTTTTSISTDAGLCICATPKQPLIYPLYFSAHVMGRGGVDQVLGTATTYVPSFFAKPAPVHVAWVWPLIDRPHRLASETEFVDDDLATTVGPEGRLYRALDVVENVGDRIPLTLVIDPELLAELDVMATGTYTVQQPDGRTIPGSGKDAAAAWLDRLRALLTADPLLQVELTPYADPDVESLSQNGLSWSASLPPQLRAAVDDALGGHAADTSIAWPPSGAISQRTLQRLAGDGVGTVVLNSTAVTPRSDADGVPAGLARLSAAGRDVAAALTTAAMQRYATQAVTIEAQPGALPNLIAEIAVRAAQEPQAEHVAVLTAPRYVDPDVDAATAAIKATSNSTFAKPIALRDAVAGALLPIGRSRLAKVPGSATTLPDSQIDAAQLVRRNLPALSSLLNPRQDAAARALLAELPVAGQRAESAAWRDQRRVGGAFADQLRDAVDAVTSGVHIVQPKSGSYTLASDNSPLPITVHNSLPYTVRVRVQVSTVVNIPGFSAKDVGVQQVDPKQNRTVNLPTDVQRPGRILVSAQLFTPNGDALGDAVQLTVHSTALGAVGIAITIVAGVVLAIALLLRLFGRWRTRNRRLPGMP